MLDAIYMHKRHFWLEHMNFQFGSWPKRNLLSLVHVLVLDLNFFDFGKQQKKTFFSPSASLL